VPLPVLPLAELLPRDIDPYLSLMILGFVISIFGHVIRARWVVAVGILMIVLACLIFPLTRIATEETPPPPRKGLEQL
jgi:hypothetical protein